MSRPSATIAVPVCRAWNVYYSGKFLVIIYGVKAASSLIFSKFVLIAWE